MNLPRRAVVRLLTSCLAAAALAATTLVPVAATAAPAPVARSGAVASSVAGSTSSVMAARTVTPPRTVTKKHLVGIFRTATRVTDAGLRRGATVRTVRQRAWDQAVATGRARSGRILLRGTAGTVSILDARTGSAYLSIAGIVDQVGVSDAQLDAALATLGRPGATWAKDPGGSAPGGLVGQSLVSVARAATAWSWQRRQGRTTWRLTVERRLFGIMIRTTEVFVLDARQRLVRHAELSAGPRFTARSTLTVRYRTVAPISLPTPAQTVDLADLMRVLGVRIARA